MWRSESESMILNTYVPAGNTPQPFRCTPGISTGALNVMVVFRFQSSALTEVATAVPRRATQNTVVAALNNFIFSFAPELFNLRRSDFGVPCRSVSYRAGAAPIAPNEGNGHISQHS